MTNIEIVPATQELIEIFFGEPPKRTIRAVVAVKDGEPIAVAGLFLDQSRYVLFSDLKPEMYKHKKAIVKTMRAARKLMDTVHLPVYAVPEKEPYNDAVIIKHLGFKEENGVYVWRS
jgi:hypothetical protein